MAGPSQGVPSLKQVHILIIGAGLTGLILAQAIRNFNASEKSARSGVKYSYSIFDRDARAFARGGGWSLTIHWALTDLRNVLPHDIISRFEDCLVNPEAAEKGIPGNFQYLNLKTGERQEAWPIPLGAASRVSREKLLALLMEGVDIKWSKALDTISYPSSTTVTAQFTDGTSETGNLIVGCDGSRSAVRRSLCPTTYQNNRLPVRLMGMRVEFPVERVQVCKNIDVHFFQGGDPATNVYFWFSFIHLPRPSDDLKVATCQIMLSWPHREGFLGRPEPTDMPTTNEERLAWIRSLASDWAEPFRGIVHDIPEETELREIVLEDWPPQEKGWDNHNGTVTLVGDAAHGMTMFRGEAANHGVIDVSVLTKLLFSDDICQQKDHSLSLAIQAYEDEMIERTRPAVLKSRQACIDANNYESVNAQSPLIAKRVVRD
ncbi:FAD/NAD(P)-binding domain-containing protein [Trichoderma barbatum]